MFINVIAGVDGLQGGRDAVALAGQLAAPGAVITLAHVYDRHSLRAHDDPRQRAKHMLGQERAAASIEAKLRAVSDSSVGRGLHRLADRQRAELVVVGSCHRGRIGRVLLRDDTRAALASAPCAVAIAPRGWTPPERLSTIGVGYDGSPESIQAIKVAAALGRNHEARVRALGVIPMPSIPYGEPVPAQARQLISQVLDVKSLEPHCDISGEITYGEPGEELARFSLGLDLLIVGSRSAGSIDRLFEGSASNFLARRMRRPLLVMPRSAGLTIWSPAESREDLHSLSPLLPAEHQTVDS